MRDVKSPSVSVAARKFGDRMAAAVLDMDAGSMFQQPTRPTRNSVYQEMAAETGHPLNGTDSRIDEQGSVRTISEVVAPQTRTLLR